MTFKFFESTQFDQPLKRATFENRKANLCKNFVKIFSRSQTQLSLHLVAYSLLLCAFQVPIFGFKRISIWILIVDRKTGLTNQLTWVLNQFHRPFTFLISLRNRLQSLLLCAFQVPIFGFKRISIWILIVDRKTGLTNQLTWVLNQFHRPFTFLISLRNRLQRNLLNQRFPP